MIILAKQPRPLAWRVSARLWLDNETTSQKLCKRLHINNFFLSLPQSKLKSLPQPFIMASDLSIVMSPWVTSTVTEPYLHSKVSWAEAVVLLLVLRRNSIRKSTCRNLNVYLHNHWKGYVIVVKEARNMSSLCACRLKQIPKIVGHWRHDAAMRGVSIWKGKLRKAIKHRKNNRGHQANDRNFQEQASAAIFWETILLQ